MKQWQIIALSAVVSGILGGLIGAALARPRLGAMPHEWASWRQVATASPPGASNSLGGVVGQVASTAMPDGGPQGFEAYTFLDHADGTTRLAIGNLGNVEVAGAGAVTEVRTLQGGGVLSGTGKVDRWVGLFVHRPRSQPGQIGTFSPVVSEDEAAESVLRGTLTTDRLRFANGWTLQASEEGLELVDAGGVVRQTFGRSPPAP